MVLGGQVNRQISRLIHPRIMRPVKLQGRVLPERTMEAVRGFFAVYVATFAVIMLILMADGMDQVTAFGAVATCINNLGPGLGETASNFSSATPEAKLLLSGAMLLGRLEIFTVLVLLTPRFWRG
jgi:trk system potassium uptake protein TrkH